MRAFKAHPYVDVHVDNVIHHWTGFLADADDVFDDHQAAAILRFAIIVYTYGYNARKSEESHHG